MHERIQKIWNDRYVKNFGKFTIAAGVMSGIAGFAGLSESHSAQAVSNTSRANFGRGMGQQASPTSYESFATAAGDYYGMAKFMGVAAGLGGIASVVSVGLAVANRREHAVVSVEDREEIA